MTSNRPLTQSGERYRVLGECLVLMEAQKRMMSRNECSEVAKPGFEAAFEEMEQRLCVLREMLRELRYGTT